VRPIPLLLLSDNPALSTGLARITKDLAVHVASLPEYRVGTLGRGGLSSSRLPFFNVAFDEAYGWGESLIEEVWNDFAGSDYGVIMTVWDLSRLDWLVRPRMGGRLQEFLTSKRFQVWGYIPVDHYGVGQKLTGIMADTLLGFDRFVAYSIFGKQVIERSIGRECDWLPHGLNGDVFQPRDKAAGRAILNIGMDERVIGMAATNQQRKDWGTAFAAFAAVKKPGMKFWCHTDVPIRHWNMYALAQDFGLNDSLIFTFNGEYNSEQLSYLYSAADVTIQPTLGEGFGYCIAESLACGIPVLHVNYAGGPELIPERDWLIDMKTSRLEGPWNCVRPVLDPREWAEKIEHVLNNYADGTHKDYCVNAIQHLYWKNLFNSCWKPWFLDGLK
jgi:glycosyltransferase involved in cell wall biosynthesis